MYWYPHIIVTRKAYAMGLFNKIFGSYNDRELKRIYPIADAIEKLEPEYAALTDDALRAKTDEFKARYNDGETLSRR